MKSASLERLDVSHNSFIDDPSIDQIIQIKLLKHLDISFCNKITDGGLHCFAKRLPKLESLNMSGLCQITDVGVIALLDSIYSTIQSLNISLLTSSCITDQIGEPLRKCIKIEVLDMSGFSEISDECINKMFVESRPDEKDQKKQVLKSLSVNNLQWISEDCFTKMLTAFPLLEKLEMINAYIGDTFLETIAKSTVTNLQEINFSMCQLSQESIDQLKEAKPYLKLIWYMLT